MKKIRGYSYERTKEDKNDDNNARNETNPNYLSINDPRFQHFIQSILPATANSLTREDAQETALYLNRIMILQ